MKFNGELKFPEIDHPGVPIQFVIEGTQTELVIEGESLGRWSLYDVRARRLVASAFLIDLDGIEVTFIADDPIDFAYRGVEHMAETWATLKSKRIASRSIAVRKSRKGTVTSRIEDMKAAMEANLEAQGTPRQLAGEVAMPEPATDTPRQVVAGDYQEDWDRRDQPSSIPLAGADPSPSPLLETLEEEARQLEEERKRVAEERVQLEQELRAAEQREADRIEAFRLEMQRLESEREEVRRQAEQIAQRAAAAEEETAERSPAEPEPTIPEPAPRHAKSVAEQPSRRQPDPEPRPAETAEEPEPRPVVETPEPEAVGAEPEPEPVAEIPEPDPVMAEPEPEPEAAKEPAVVDLKEFEKGRERIPSLDSDTPAAEPKAPAPAQPVTPHEPEPAMAAAGKDRSGLMGVVRAAFRSGPRDHDHQFVEAPGGIGITRYVCEECGHVSISV